MIMQKGDYFCDFKNWSHTFTFTKVKNVWSYTFILIYAFMMCPVSTS
jgi:hypothetical protein